MNKIPIPESSSNKTDAIENNSQVKFEEEVCDHKIDKVLCNHCGRSTKNGIRCLGICVADNDY